MPIMLRSVADTPGGVPARRNRRGSWGKDATPHAPGPRKMVSLRRHGGNRRVTDRPPVSDARKSAPDVPVRHTRWPAGWFRRIPDPSETPGSWRRTTARPGHCRETGVAGKNRRTGCRKVSPLLSISRQLPAPRPNFPSLDRQGTRLPCAGGPSETGQEKHHVCRNH